MGFWVVIVKSGVLMVATSILPMINVEVFLVIYQCGLIQYINLECVWGISFRFWGSVDTSWDTPHPK